MLHRKPSLKEKLKVKASRLKEKFKKIKVEPEKLELKVVKKLKVKK